MSPNNDTMAGNDRWKQQLKDLKRQLKDAQKRNDIATVAETWRDIATCYDALGDKKAAEKARVTQNEVTKKGLVDLREGMLKQKEEQQAKEAARASFAAKVAQAFVGPTQKPSNAQDREAKRAQFFKITTDFKRRLQESNLIIPEVSALVRRADQAMERGDLEDAAEIFVEIARVVEGMESYRSRWRDDFDPFFIPFFSKKPR